MLANTTLEVAEACSGIRSLVSLLTLAIVYGYFIEPRTWARVALALASIPVAIVANGVRVAGTGIAAHYFGAEAAQGFFHTFSGWLVFVVAFVLLFGVQRLIARVGRAAAAPPRPPSRRSRRAAIASDSPHRQSDTSPSNNRRSRIRRLTRRARRASSPPRCSSRPPPASPARLDAEPTPPRQSFDSVPHAGRPVAGRVGRPLRPADVLTVLGVDEYVNRDLLRARPAAGRPVHRLLPEPAPGRHDALAAQLPARRRLGAGDARARVPLTVERHGTGTAPSAAGRRQPHRDPEGPRPPGGALLVPEPRPRGRPASTGARSTRCWTRFA